MPPVLWNFDGNVLVVKIIGSHTTADISRAFTEAMIDVQPARHCSSIFGPLL
jgi:hypothetical protein